MENSDEELEWREIVERARRADFEQKSRLDRPRWVIMADEVAPTIGKIALVLFCISVLLASVASVLAPYIPTP